MKARLHILEFEPWHRKLIKPGRYYSKPDLDPELEAGIYRQLIGYTILIDDEIAAILGIVPLWPGVVEVMVVPSDVFYKNLKRLIPICRHMLSVAAEIHPFHRMQGVALANQPTHIRFLEFMGFQREGLMRKYGPTGEDMIMFSYIPVQEEQ